MKYPCFYSAVSTPALPVCCKIEENLLQESCWEAGSLQDALQDCSRSGSVTEAASKFLLHFHPPKAVCALFCLECFCDMKHWAAAVTKMNQIQPQNPIFSLHQRVVAEAQWGQCRDKGHVALTNTDNSFVISKALLFLRMPPAPPSRAWNPKDLVAALGKTNKQTFIAVCSPRG